MDEIAKTLGLSDGAFIPMASDENNNLEFEILELQKEKETLQAQNDEEKDKLSGMNQFLNNILNEQTGNQQSLTTYEREVQLGNEITRAVLGDVSNCNAAQRSFITELDQIKERQDFLQVESDRVIIRLNKLKSHLRWDEEALEAWNEELARMSQDAALLDEFNKRDDSAFNELDLRRKSIREEVDAKRNKLETLKDDVLCLEHVLEKTGNVFQQQHNDRQALVGQWEASVRVLHQRDLDINRGIEEIGGLRAQAKQRMRDLMEHKTFYENEIRNNKELERDTAKTAKEAQDLKEEAMHLESVTSDMYGQLHVLRGSLSTSANLIQRHRIKCRRMNEEILKKRHFCQKMRLRLERLYSEIEQFNNKNSSAADRVSQLENLKAEENKTSQRLDYDFTKLQEILRSVSEELLNLNNQDKDQRNLMSSMENNGQNLRRRTHFALEEQQRQSNILYAAEMLYVEKELQYKRMHGDLLDEDKEGDERKVAELEEIKSKLEEAHNLLTKERYHLDQEYRRLSIFLHSDDKDLRTLQSKKQDNVLKAEGSQKQLKSLQLENQNRQVDENVIKLRVKQMEKAVERVGGKLYSLEKHRLELDEAVKERGMEVDALMDVLNVQKRVLSEQASALKSKINVAKLKVEHQRKRYEVNMSSLGTDENGEAESVAYYKIKAAQERYELQQIGDKLDETIRKTEKEIRAMENTLKIVRAANRNFKSSLMQGVATEEELEQKESLENTYLEIVNKIRENKNILQSLGCATDELVARINEQVDLENNITRDWKEKDAKAAELDAELLDQEEKLARAARSLRKLIKDVRGTNQTRFQTIEEKDIELREILDQNQSAMQQLSEISIRHVEAGPVVLRYLQEKGLGLPEGPSSHLCTSGRLSASSRSNESLTARSRLTIDSSMLDDVDVPLSKRSIIRKEGFSKADNRNSKSRRSTKVDFIDVRCDDV